MAPDKMLTEGLVENTMSTDVALAAADDNHGVNNLSEGEAMMGTELSRPWPTVEPQKAINPNGAGAAPFKLRAPAFSQFELNGMIAAYKTDFGDGGFTTCPEFQLSSKPPGKEEHDEVTTPDTCADKSSSGDDQYQSTSLATSFDTVPASPPGAISFHMVDKGMCLSEEVFSKHTHMQSTAAIEQATSAIGSQFNVGDATKGVQGHIVSKPFQSETAVQKVTQASPGRNTAAGSGEITARPVLGLNHPPSTTLRPVWQDDQSNDQQVLGSNEKAQDAGPSDDQDSKYTEGHTATDESGKESEAQPSQRSTVGLKGLLPQRPQPGDKRPSSSLDKSEDRDNAVVKRRATARKCPATARKTIAGRKNPAGARKKRTPKAAPTARKAPSTVKKTAESAAAAADKKDYQPVQQAQQVQQATASDAESDVEYTIETATEASKIWTARIARLNRERSRHQNPVVASRLHKLVRSLQANRLKALDSVGFEVDEETTRKEDVWDRVRQHNESIKKLWKATERDRRDDAQVREATYEQIDAEILERQEILESIDEEDADLLLMGFIPAIRRRAGKTVMLAAAPTTRGETPAPEISEPVISEYQAACDDTAGNMIAGGNTDSLFEDSSSASQDNGNMTMNEAGSTEQPAVTSSQGNGNVAAASANIETNCVDDLVQVPSDQAIEPPLFVEPATIEVQDKQIVANADATSTEEISQQAIDVSSSEQPDTELNPNKDSVLAIDDQTQSAQCVVDFLPNPPITEAEMYANIAPRKASACSSGPSNNELSAYPFNTHGNSITAEAIASIKEFIAGQKENGDAETSPGEDSPKSREQMLREFEQKYVKDHNKFLRLDDPARIEVGRLSFEEIVALQSDSLEREPPAWITEYYGEVDSDFGIALDADGPHFQLQEKQTAQDAPVKQHVSAPAIAPPKQLTQQEEAQGPTALASETSIQQLEDDNRPPEQFEYCLSKQPALPREEEFAGLIALGELMQKEDEDLKAATTAKEQQQVLLDQGNKVAHFTAAPQQPWQQNFQYRPQHEHFMMDEADQTGASELGMSASQMQMQMQMYAQLQHLGQEDQMPQNLQVHFVQQDYQRHHTPALLAQQDMQLYPEIQPAQLHHPWGPLPMQHAPAQVEPHPQHQVAHAPVAPMAMMATGTFQKQPQVKSNNQVLWSPANIVPARRQRQTSSKYRRASRKKASGDDTNASLAPLAPMIPSDYAAYLKFSQQVRAQPRQAGVDITGAPEYLSRSWKLIDQNHMKTDPPLYPRQVRVLSDMSDHFHFRQRQILAELRAAEEAQRAVEAHQSGEGDQQPQDAQSVEQLEGYEQPLEYAQGQTNEQEQLYPKYEASQPADTHDRAVFPAQTQAYQPAQAGHNGQYVDHSQAFRGIQQDQLDGLSPTSQIMRISDVWEITKPAATTFLSPAESVAAPKLAAPAPQTPKKATPSKRGPRGPYRKGRATPSSPPTDSEGNPIKRKPGRPCRKDSENAYKRSRFAKTMVEDAEHTQPPKMGKRNSAKVGKKTANAQSPTDSMNAISLEPGQHEVQYQADPNAALGLNISAEAYVANSIQQKMAATRARSASQAMQKMQQSIQTPRVAPQSPKPTPSRHRAIAPKIVAPQLGNAHDGLASSFVHGQATNMFECLEIPTNNFAQTNMIAMQPAVHHNVAMLSAAPKTEHVDHMDRQGYMQPQSFQQGMARASDPMNSGSQKPATATQPSAAQHAVQSPGPMRNVHGDVAQQNLVQPQSVQASSTTQHPMPAYQPEKLTGSKHAQKARQQRQQLQSMIPLPPAMRNGTAQGNSTPQKRKPDEPQQFSFDGSKRQKAGMVQDPGQQVMSPAMGMQAYHLSPMPQMMRSRQVSRHAELQNIMTNTQSDMGMGVNEEMDLEGEIERLEQANAKLQNEAQDNNQKMRWLRQNGMSQTPVYQSLLQQKASFKSQFVQNDGRLEQLQDMLHGSAGMGMATTQHGQMPGVNPGFMAMTPQHVPIDRPGYHGQDLFPADEVDDNNLYVGMKINHTDMSSHFAGGLDNGTYTGH